MIKVVAVIPARLKSSRLPNKVLLRETGKPLIQHVYEGAAKAKSISELVIATDHPEVVEECGKFGAKAILTSEACQSGTDRVAEAAAMMPDADLILNVQGDEPEMDGAVLDVLVKAMLKAGRSADMGTVATPWPNEIPLGTPGCVKVVTDRNGYAMYFSRSVVPHVRDVAAEWAAEREVMARARSGGFSKLHMRHIGIYAYWREVLLEFAAMPASVFELAESLEQLRALEAGKRILVVEAPYVGAEVNTPEDYAAFVERQRRRGG